MNGCQEFQMLEDVQDAKVITLIERKNHQNKIKNDWALRNKDRRKQHTKNYRDKNQEKIKKYRSESRDKALIYSKKWDERNPEKRRARTAVMHAINAGIIKNYLVKNVVISKFMVITIITISHLRLNGCALNIIENCIIHHRTRRPIKSGS